MVPAQIADFAVTVLAFLVAVGIVIFVHEFGHYLAARLSGISVKVFSVGFLRPLVSWRDSRGTVWRIGMLPLGGYVRFADADGAEGQGSQVSPDSQPPADSLAAAALHHRFFTVIAGPLANFVFSTIVFAVLVLSVGVVSGDAVIGKLRTIPGERNELREGDRITQLNGAPVGSLVDLYGLSDLQDTGSPAIYTVERDGGMREAIGPMPMPPIIDGVRLMSAASDAGLKSGDVVLAVDGVPIRSFGELRRAVGSAGERTMMLDVWRNGEEFRVALSGRIEELPSPEGGFEKRVVIGVTGGLFFEPEVRTPSLADAARVGIGRSLQVIVGTIEGVAAIVTSQISACNLQGPVGIARVSGEAASQGGLEFVSFVAIISVVIGLLNLLPIPGLDGGHLAFYVYEAFARRPPSSGFQRVSITLGFVLVAMLMTFGLFNDLTCA